MGLWYNLSETHASKIACIFNGMKSIFIHCATLAWSLETRILSIYGSPNQMQYTTSNPTINNVLQNCLHQSTWSTNIIFFCLCILCSMKTSQKTTVNQHQHYIYNAKISTLNSSPIHVPSCTYAIVDIWRVFLAKEFYCHDDPSAHCKQFSPCNGYETFISKAERVLLARTPRPEVNIFIPSR